MADILVLGCPPAARTFACHAHADAGRRARRSRAGPSIEVRDLYALYPDYFVDAAAEQAALAGGKSWWCGCTRCTGTHAAVDEAVGSTRSYLRLGLRPGRHGAARQGPVAGRLHRRRAESYRPDGLEPLLLRRLPAAVRADRALVGHALPAAAGVARRAPHQRRRGRRARADFRVRAGRLPAWPEIAELPACDARGAGGRAAEPRRPEDLQAIACPRIP